jgi:hypothetical protein
MTRETIEMEIQLQDEIISGQLKIIGEVWRFNADHSSFKALFPTGSVCSFISEAELKEPNRMLVYRLVQEKVTALQAGGIQRESR